MVHRFGGCLRELIVSPTPICSALTIFSDDPQDDVFTEASAVAEPVSLETAEVEDELIAEELVATVEQVAFEAVSIKIALHFRIESGHPLTYLPVPFGIAGRCRCYGLKRCAFGLLSDPCHQSIGRSACAFCHQDRGLWICGEV